ncbi:TonB-dependent receptor family protein [Marinilongibacter aquaticus]|uniref:outer membrane beta-barrel family protein n=1 Tax=Marinilongibacter aquaticus TaxID=2975157 RepID=UPI0021BD1AB7|nr:outer membrane beta-barrel family protein [Marinilongibacter aquaticus]UBM58339.1 TonB-dependent receptor family protein [Marinilongibacter aquaticus]
MRIFITHIFIFTLFTFSTLAQSAAFEVEGRILKSDDKSPIPFATIQLVDNTDQKPFAGGIADENGRFSIESAHSNFYVDISFIGFENRQIKQFQKKGNTFLLGDILLNENTRVLDDVVVRAEKSQTEFSLDKRVFNVGKDLSTTGASALEVLNHVPSVTVNIEGQISLRGSSGVQILINGKPSVLASEQSNALGTITAEMIEKVEVITNPSAKYEAEGTSGIINIILKKEERKGLNGSLSLNTGMPDNHSFGMSLNRRTEKFNLFSQLGAGYRSLPSYNENINLDKSSGQTVSSSGTEYRNETFYNFILGTDYHINALNVLTLSGNFAFEAEKQPSQTNYVRTNADGEVLSKWFRDESTSAGNPKWQYDFQYKKQFANNKEHSLLASAVGSFFGKDQNSDFTNMATLGEIDLVDQQTRTNFKEAENVLKLDYTNPFTEEVKIEAGSQYVINDVSNDYAVSNLENGEWIENPDLTNLFDYNQKVFALYTTAAYERKAWGLKLGGRLEHTRLHTLLANTGTSNLQKYTNFFPSLHTSYKFTKTVSVQAGYSKRIYRPRLWDLNPFFNIRNNFNVRTGNPNLRPEFTDSYEITSIYDLDKLSLNAGVYYRYTSNVIDRISTFENGVSYSKPLNIGTNKTTGIEVNGKYELAKWISLAGDINVNMFKREGQLEARSFDFSSNNWTSRLNAKFKLPADIDIELTGNHRSGYQTIQGSNSAMSFMDMGLRKKILKGKGVVNIGVRDLFASRIYRSTADQEHFYLYNRRKRGRFVTLGFSYGFGKGEAMEFNGIRRH